MGKTTKSTDNLALCHNKITFNTTTQENFQQITTDKTNNRNSSKSVVSFLPLQKLKKRSKTTTGQLISSTSSTSVASSISTSLPVSSFKFTPTMNFYKRIAVSFLVILEVLLVPVYAGPINVRHHRMQRDIYTDLDNKSTGTSKNETQQDGTCLLDGIITKRATIHCETKAGCKAIQKTGYCCPEYQCECEKDGKLYSNGDTLPDQNQTPCKVCFCKGGEIVCTNVTCYTRDDCEAKYIPGRCCPEYDNCPPLEIGKSTTAKTLTGLAYNTGSDTTDNTLSKYDYTSAASAIHHQQSHEMPLNNPLNITIKEITKVEEIRITDAPPVNGLPKPKLPISQGHSTGNSVATPTNNNNNNNGKNGILSTTLTQVTALKDSQQQSLNSIEGKNLEDEIIASLSTTGDSHLNGENTKLTLVETKTILFPATDSSTYHNEKISTTQIPPYSPNYPTTEINKVVISDNSLLNGEESIKIVRHASVPTNSHNSKGESNLIQGNHNDNEKDGNNYKISSSGEQAGEQVVIIDKNGQSKPITVFGIKGLQRGDVIEDPSLSTGNNRFDNNNSEKGQDKNRGSSTSSKEYGSNESSDVDPIQASSSDDFVRVVYGSTTERVYEVSDYSEDLNATKAGEDDVYEPVFYEEGLDSSSVSPIISSSTEETFDTVYYTPEPEAGEKPINESYDESQIYDTVFHSSDDQIFEPVFHDLENDTISTSGPENVSSEPFPFEPVDEGEVNPAYPKIEEDLSIHREINGAAADYLEGNTETKSLVHASHHIKEEPRSVISSLHLDNSDILLSEFKSESTTEFSNFFDLLNSTENDTLSNDILDAEPRVPGEPCLIPEWERINGTTDSRCNRTLIDSTLEDYGIIMDLDLLKANESFPSSSEIEIDSGSGSGIDFSSAANLIDNREPTTPNPNKIIDIDELDSDSSNSGATSLRKDPKEDAESLKLDEDDNSPSSSGLGLNGVDIAGEINKKSTKSFYGFDSFIFY